MHDIAANLEHIRERIAAAAARAGRKADEIKLIAVSKTHSVDSVAAVLRAGQRSFGESATQEALTKIPLLREYEPEWHFIGHLQSNKAKFIPGNFQWLHSLDSFALAQRLSRFAQQRQVELNALIEVNITADPAKHGIAPAQLFTMLEQLLEEKPPAVRLRGLMTIGPHAVSSSASRSVFAALQKLRHECIARYSLRDFTELSMGMTDDFEDAIKEGATLVRIGTAVFGKRDY